MSLSNPTRLDQAAAHRLRELREVVRSGATESVGKGLRSETGEVVRRGRGGVSVLYPELRRAGVSPGMAAKAVERGKGKVYRRLHSEARRELAEYYPERKRYPQRPVIPPHRKMTKKCKLCKVPHGKGEHRFHGPGAFQQTHLFSFNPKIPENFARYLQHIGYLPSALRPDLLASLYEQHMKDREKRRAFIEWEQGRKLTAEGPLFNPKKQFVLTRVKQGRSLYWSATGWHPDAKFAEKFHSKEEAERWREHHAGFDPSYRDSFPEPVGRLTKAQFNCPKKKRKAARKNPPGAVVIYGAVERIFATKTQRHRCDSACKRSGHRYYHDFKVKPVMYGLPDGSILIKK